MTTPISWGSLASFPLSCGYRLIAAARGASFFWDPTHCCFSIGEVDLIPTMEEYAKLLQLDSPFSETPVIPIQGPRLLRSAFPARLARDFIAGKKDGRNSESMPSRSPSQETGRGGRVLHAAPSALVLQSPAAFFRLQTPYHFERHTVSQTVQIALPFTGDSRAWALYLLDLPLSGWAWKVTWGPASWMPWTHCALFDGVPLPGVWGCTGYYPSLALRQFSGVQYPPRLGDLDAVTFDYIPSEDMWRLLFRIEDIWGGRLSEMVLIEEGSPGDSSVTSDFVEWREGWTPFFTLRPTVRPGAPYSLISRSLRVSASTGQPERVTALERELEEAQTELLSLRLARASEREASAARVESLRSTLHHNSVAVANLRRDLVAQRGNVSTLRTMNEFIREQLEISEDAKEQLEETLAEAREQLETEQAERTRVQDELDSLRSYTQALVDPATGRPQDIVALRRALDASEEALTSARTSMGVMRVQISVLQGDNGVLQSELDLVHDALESNASWLNQEGFPVVTSLHQINQVMDSLGARARAVWEEHDEGDPALSTALGRFCRETCIRLGH
uniref:Uncharacterized protein n=1 Tax=Fagus sylvatica TaxID=28930 RepID=A0A2N9HEY2_FAGSY